MKDRHKGILVALVGILCISPDAVLVRFLTSGESNTDPWTLLFWKLLLSVAVSAPYAVYEAGGAHRLWNSIVQGKWYYAAVLPVQTAVDICFTFSFVHASAANALLLINLNPLWCALIGRLFLGDVLPIYTIVALVLAMCCILIIFVPEMVSRRRDDDDDSNTEEQTSTLKGNIISLFTGMALAVYISIMRKGAAAGINLIGAAALSALLVALISILVRKGDVLPDDYWRGNGGALWQFWLAVLGEAMGAGIVFVALTIAPRLITGAEVAVVLLLEVILGPLWVFVAYGDVPSRWTLIGGSLLLAVLALHESRPLFQKAHGGFKSMRSKSRLETGVDDNGDDDDDKDDDENVMDAIVEEGEEVQTGDKEKSETVHVNDD